MSHTDTAPISPGDFNITYQSTKSKQSSVAFKDNQVKLVNAVDKLVNKKPTMPQKMAILKEWFVGVCGDSSGCLDIKEIGYLLVRKGMVADVDTAQKSVLKKIKMSAD